MSILNAVFRSSTLFRVTSPYLYCKCSYSTIKSFIHNFKLIMVVLLSQTNGISILKTENSHWS